MSRDCSGAQVGLAVKPAVEMPVAIMPIGDRGERGERDSMILSDWQLG